MVTLNERFIKHYLVYNSFGLHCLVLTTLKCHDRITASCHSNETLSYD